MPLQEPLMQGPHLQNPICEGPLEVEQEEQLLEELNVDGLQKGVSGSIPAQDTLEGLDRI